MAQHTINLPCIKDTWIDESNPNTSHGSDSILIGGDFNGSSGGGKAYALLAFDWSSLPARKKITGIKLKFYNVNSLELGGASYCRFVISCMQGTWDESTTWHTNPYTYIGSGPNYLENVNIPGSQYYEITLSLSDVMYQNRIVNNGIYVNWYKVIDNQVQPSYVTMHSRENTYPPMLVLTYEDIPPLTPTPTGPMGAYKDSKSVIRFAWQYNSDVGGVQKAFDLQYSTDQSTWTTVSETTANNYYDMPADTLPAGNVYWRVRTYNEYDEVGPYCDIQSFYAIGAPAAPVLNAIPVNSARPVVSWSAFSQQVYQLQVLSGDTIVYDSGVVPGINIRQHKIKAWLADGEYTVRIRIKNEYDLWSEWGSAVVTISTVKPTKPTLAVAKTNHGLRAVVVQNGLDYILVYRDGKCVKKQATNIITDDSGTIINLLGKDGDCEDISQFSIRNVQQDTILKLFGSKSFKLQATDDEAWVNQNININAEYILICGYVYLRSGRCRMMILDSTALHGNEVWADETTLNQWQRIGAKYDNRQYPITSWFAGTPYLGSAGGIDANIDGIMIIEITAEEYDTMTVDQLLTKYPYGNSEAYIIDDNTGVNGKSYGYKARAVQDVPERSITNLLGSDGDCEDISQFSIKNVQQDTILKLFGSKSFKLQATDDEAWVNQNININAEYILICGYVYLRSGRCRMMILDSTTLHGNEVWADETTLNQWQRIGAKYDNRQYPITSWFAGTPYLGSAGGIDANIDGIMIIEITAEEYDTMTVDQLLAKYPFGNNTFTAPAYEVYNDSDPVSATAEIKNALIAPVSDLTNIFTFTRALNAPPKRTYNHQPSGAFVEYAGRTHPVWEPTEHVSTAWSMSFFLKSWEDVEELIDLIERKETVLYRDARGRKVYGVLGNLSVTDERGGYSVSFTLTEVDHSEEVEV